MCKPDVLEMVVRQKVIDILTTPEITELLYRAWDEHEETGRVFVDTAFALSNLGIDPEIVTEEANRHGK